MTEDTNKAEPGPTPESILSKIEKELLDGDPEKVDKLRSLLETDIGKTDTPSTESNTPPTPEPETKVTESVQEKLSKCEDQLLRAKADYQNLERQSNDNISEKILQQKNQLMLEFAVIYEDFIRAKSALENESVSIQGLEAIIKKMKSLLNENHIEEIEAKKGKPFDPNYHEAISTVEDNSLDDDTIIEEVAKGYISSGKVIKYSKVIVSKKNEKGEMKNG